MVAVEGSVHSSKNGSMVMRNGSSFDRHRSSNQIDNIDIHAFTVNDLCWLHNNMYVTVHESSKLGSTW